MPGSSLWLLPPADHPLQDILTLLIKQTSSSFNSPHLFIPHVTLTSEISPSHYGSDPQGWVDSLNLIPANDVRVRFQELASEEVFVRKLYIKCEKNEGLKKLGELCRKEVDGFAVDRKAAAWAENVYNPHLSLLYHDCSRVAAGRLSEIEKLADDAGVSLSCERGQGGWTGGVIVLVPTDKPINQWIPIAQRQL